MKQRLVLGRRGDGGSGRGTTGRHRRPPLSRLSDEVTVGEEPREHEEGEGAQEVQDGRQDEAHPPRPHPRRVLLREVGGLPGFHVHREELPPNPVPQGRSHDGHGVEQSQVDGDVLGIDDVVDVGRAEGKEGRGTHPDQGEADDEQEVGEAVTLGARVSDALPPAKLGPGV